MRRSNKRNRYFIDLPGRIAETFKPEGIAVYQENESTLIGYSEIFYHKLRRQLKRHMQKFQDSWYEELFNRPDCYDLFMNNATEFLPITGKRRVWLPRKFVPNEGGPVVVSILDEKRFSIEFLV